MNSLICRGHVMHARAWPVPHRFSYPVYFYVLDIDELDALDAAVPLFGHNRRRLVAIHDRDYLLPGDEPLRTKLAEVFKRFTGTSPELGRVMLVTAARFCNYVFNPVSFFYCQRPDGGLHAVVTNVNNTFGDTHVYILSGSAAPRPGFIAQYRAVKEFHVSPFFDMDGAYDFHFSAPGPDLDILMHLVKHEKTAFVARLRGRGAALTTGSLAATIARLPFTAVLTMPRILWQAARLHYQRGLPVYHRPCPESPQTVRFMRPALSRRLARKAVLGRFVRLRHGSLRLTLPDRRQANFGNPAAGAEAAVEVRVCDDDFFWRLLTAGEIGLGEAYTAGDWDSPDPAAFIRLLIANIAAIEGVSTAAGWPARLAGTIAHRLRANTLRGSRRNIREHYDLSNEFFALFLDPTMTYSAAVFAAPDEDLEAAQLRKLQRIIDKAAIGPNDHVLEIGCGWGSFAIEAARRTGCRVTGITISENQRAMAEARVRAAGLADRVCIEIRDYRRLEEQFDRVVSIEMIEAVGHRYLPEYFRAIDRALKPGGRAVIQAITIPDQRYENYRKGTDWIRKHIFPGGHLPSLGAICSALAAGSTLTVDQVESIGPHYAETLRRWQTRLVAARDQVLALGFPEKLYRTWRFYMSYCEAGFDTAMIDDLQLVLRRAGPEPCRPFQQALPAAKN